MSLTPYKFYGNEFSLFLSFHGACVPAEMKFFILGGNVTVARDAFSTCFAVAGFHRSLFPLVFHFDSPFGFAVRVSRPRRQVLHCM